MQRNARKVRYGILAADITWMIFALLLASAFRQGFQHPFQRMLRQDATYLPILGASVAGWVVVYVRMELDGFRRGWGWGKVTSEVAVGIGILNCFSAACAYLLHDYVPRIVLLYYAVLLLVGFVAIRAFAHFVLSCKRVKPTRRVVIIGSCRVARELSLKLEAHPEMLCEVVGFLYPSVLEPESVLGAPALGGVSVQALSAVELLQQKGVTDVVVVLSGQRASHGTQDMVARCREAGMQVSLVPQSYELYASRPALMDLDGVPLISLRKPSSNFLMLACKRAVDLVATLPLLALSIPLLAVPAVYLALRTGHVFRRDPRCGKDGRTFSMYRLDVDRSGSSGVTGFESLLLQTSLTELPQLWNVLRGDMSLVGPRPEAPDRVKHYSEWQQRRLRMKPGITGLAQVHGLRDQNSSEEKTRFDLQYIVSWNPVSDCVLVLQTVWTLIVRLCGAGQNAGPITGKLSAASYTEFAHADSAESSAD